MTRLPAATDKLQDMRAQPQTFLAVFTTNSSLRRCSSSAIPCPEVNISFPPPQGA